MRQNPFLPIDPPPLPSPGAKPLEVLLVRGAAGESRHRVHVWGCDARGEARMGWGNPALTFFPRSAIKLIQAVGWVALNYEIAQKLGEEELAIACGSHEGESFHVRTVERWLKALGLSERDLECGVHEPSYEPAARQLIRDGQPFCQIHNNCSGKHAGLLTACVAEGWPTAGYSNFDHPVQIRLRRVMQEFMGLDMSAQPWGIDGCGIPTFSLSLASIALGMARSANPEMLSQDSQHAVARLNQAIAAKPEFIGGTDSFSSKVVAETGGRVFAKLGAEGVYGVWIPAEGLGIALKCEDGNARATEAALVRVLAELGYPLSFYSPLVRRWTGEVVGQFVCG